MKTFNISVQLSETINLHKNARRIFRKFWSAPNVGQDENIKRRDAAYWLMCSINYCILKWYQDHLAGHKWHCACRHWEVFTKKKHTHKILLAHLVRKPSCISHLFFPFWQWWKSWLFSMSSYALGSNFYHQCCIIWFNVHWSRKILLENSFFSLISESVYFVRIQYYWVGNKFFSINGKPSYKFSKLNKKQFRIEFVHPAGIICSNDYISSLHYSLDLISISIQHSSFHDLTFNNNGCSVLTVH